MAFEWRRRELNPGLAYFSAGIYVCSLSFLAGVTRRVRPWASEQARRLWD